MKPATTHTYYRYDLGMQGLSFNHRMAGEWVYKGHALKASGKYYETLLALEKSIELDPLQAEALYLGPPAINIGPKGRSLRCYAESGLGNFKFEDLLEKS